MIHETTYGDVRCELRYTDDGMFSYYDVYFKNGRNETYLGELYADNYESYSDDDGDEMVNDEFLEELEEFLDDHKGLIKVELDKKTILYAVVAEVVDENDTKTSVIGVFDNEDRAKRIALAELCDRYAYDVQDMYDNDESACPLDKDNLQYVSNIDWYNVSMSIRKVNLNERMVDFKNV